MYLSIYQFVITPQIHVKHSTHAKIFIIRHKPLPPMSCIACLLHQYTLYQQTLFLLETQASVGEEAAAVQCACTDLLNDNIIKAISNDDTAREDLPRNYLLSAVAIQSAEIKFTYD